MKGFTSPLDLDFCGDPGDLVRELEIREIRNGSLHQSANPVTMEQIYYAALITGVGSVVLVSPSCAPEWAWA